MVEQWNTDNINQKIIDKLEMVGELIEGEVKNKISNYEPKPLVDSGKLLGSITHEVDEDNLTVYIGTDTEYAPYVELGTSKMQPHPFLRPAVYENIDNIKRIMTDA